MPPIKISDLDAQLESIKEKNRRYRGGITQKCYEEEDEPARGSYLAQQPRAFRLGEADFQEGSSEGWLFLDKQLRLLYK
jgi:hypothetical protein